MVLRRIHVKGWEFHQGRENLEMGLLNSWLVWSLAFRINFGFWMGSLLLTVFLSRRIFPNCNFFKSWVRGVFLTLLSTSTYLFFFLPFSLICFKIIILFILQQYEPTRCNELVSHGGNLKRWHQKLICPWIQEGSLMSVWNSVLRYQILNCRLN